MGAGELLRHLVKALEKVGVPYALGGSIASIAYGEPRATLDIDVVASLRPEGLGAFCERFPPTDFCLSRGKHLRDVRAMLDISGAEIERYMSFG